MDAVLLTEHQQGLPRRDRIAIGAEPELARVDVVRVDPAALGLERVPPTEARKGQTPLKERYLALSDALIGRRYEEGRRLKEEDDAHPGRNQHR